MGAALTQSLDDIEKAQVPFDEEEKRRTILKYVEKIDDIESD